MHLHFAQPVRQSRRRDDPHVIQRDQGEVPQDDKEVDAEGELVDQGSGLVPAVLLVPHQSQHQSVARRQDREEESRGDHSKRGRLGDPVVRVGVSDGVVSRDVSRDALWVHF